ncbi:MAG: T9SS type A sorting domain-containing protein [Bacteroidota bacterium]
MNRNRTRSLRRLLRNKLMLLSLFLLCFTFSHAQRFVDVEPDQGNEIGSLNIAISGDTTATGERIDPLNTIYRLRRGGTYRLNLSIQNSGFPLSIQAEEGDGPLPRLIPALTLEGNTDVPFRISGDLTLVNIEMTGRTTGAGLEGQIIRLASEDLRVVVDSCRVDESSQSFIRTDARGGKIFVTNSIISRMGTPNDIDNGRVIDDRNNFIDTLVMENNTIYNVTSRVIRDGNGADSFINYCLFNQNTVLNVGQRMADFGPVLTFVFTNNIIVNPSFNGVGVDPDPFDPTQPDPNNDRPTESIILDDVSDEVELMFGRTQTATIRNNNIYTTQNILDARPVNDPDGGDLIVDRPIFSLRAEDFIGDDTTNITEVLEFSDQPTDPIVFIDEFYTNGVASSPWDNTGSPFDFSYDGSTISGTFSITGGQLGDLNWPLLVFNDQALIDLVTEATTLLNSLTSGNNIGDVLPEAADSLQQAIDIAEEFLNQPFPTEDQIRLQIANLELALDFFLGSIITSISNDEPSDINSSVNIFPNPILGSFFVETDKSIKGISLLNFQGISVSNMVEKIGQAEFQVSESLPEGMFFLSIEFNDGSSFTQKIIKR